MRLATVPRAGAIAAKNIHLVCDGVEMPRVDADAVPTKMIDDLAIIDLSTMETKGFAMSESVLSDSSVPIPVGLKGRPEPRPTLVCIAYYRAA